MDGHRTSIEQRAAAEGGGSEAATMPDNLVIHDALVQEIADRVYAWLRAELDIERERARWFGRRDATGAYRGGY